MHRSNSNKSRLGYKLPLLERGSAILTEITGWPLSWSSEPPGSDGRIDRVFHIEPDKTSNRKSKPAAPPKSRRKLDVAVVCMPKVTIATLSLRLPALRELQDTSKMPVMLLAPSIPASCSSVLRDNQIPYLDLKGNFSLKAGNVCIWFADAAKSIESKQSRWPIEKLNSMSEAATRLTYTLLQDPDRVKWPFRRLAEHSQIAVGSVKTAMDWLERHEHVRKFNQTGKRALVRRRELLAKWVQSYAERMRPKLMIGRYRVVMEESPEYGPSTALFAPPKSPESWVAGGPIAATALLQTGYASGGQMIYIRDVKSLNQIIARNRLRIDALGAVELLTTFWPIEDETHPGFAPPLVIYADLLDSGSSRQWEFAEQIYDRYLKERLGDE